MLRDEVSSTDRRHLSASIQDDGALRIVGHDLGDGVEQALGSGIREYEWITEVAASDIPRLIDALGGTPGSELLEVIRTRCLDDATRLEAAIRKVGIQPKFWSRMGD